MPGNSNFIVPPAGWVYDPAATDPVFLTGAYYRAVPTAASNFQANLSSIEVIGNPSCGALEAATPPTLRTAYDIYALSIPWIAFVQLVPGDTTQVASITCELALLINDLQAWVGTENVLNGIPASQGVALATGQITADLINPVRLNPRERLSLRLGVALSTPVEDGSPWPRLTAAVAAQVIYPITTPASWTLQQGVISYQILDLPGSRVL